MLDLTHDTDTLMKQFRAFAHKVLVFTKQKKSPNTEQWETLNSFFRHQIIDALGLTTEHLEANEKILLGYAKAIDLREACIDFIHLWVEYVEQLLLVCPKGSYPYTWLMQGRFINYSEYQQLLNINVKEEHFSRIRAFEYFMVDSDTTRQQFIANKKDNVEDYLQLLQTFQPYISTFFFRQMKLRLPIKEMYRHTFLVGQTGSGKSEFLKLIFYGLYRSSLTSSDKTLILIEPHGDLCKELAYLIKDNERLVYINPNFQYFKEKTIVINPFDIKYKNEHYIGLRTQVLVNLIKEMMASTSLSSNMESLMKPVISTLLRMNGTSFTDLADFMDDENNSHLVAQGLKSPISEHRKFFKSGFHKSIYKPTKGAIYNRILSLIQDPKFKALTCGKSTIDIEDLMDSGKIVLFDVSKGVLSGHVAQTFGRFVIGLIQSFALQRAIKPKHSRKPVFLFVDEFQNFLSPSIEEILNESRKYALYLIAASQHIGQVTPSKLLDSILSNTNVKIVGQNADKTIDVMSKDLGIPKKDLKEINQFNFYVGIKKTRSYFKIKTPDFLITNKNFRRTRDNYENYIKYILDQSGIYTAIPKELTFTEEDIERVNEPTVTNPLTHNSSLNNDDSVFIPKYKD